MNNLIDQDAQVTIKQGRRTVKFTAKNLQITREADWDDVRNDQSCTRQFRYLKKSKFSYAGEIKEVDGTAVTVYDKPTWSQRLASIKTYLFNKIIGKLPEEEFWEDQDLYEEQGGDKDYSDGI